MVIFVFTKLVKLNRWLKTRESGLIYRQSKQHKGELLPLKMKPSKSRSVRGLSGIKHIKQFFPRNSWWFCCSLGQDDNDSCNLFNGTWVRDLRGSIYTNITCPTMPDSKNCRKYGKPMDYVNWRWMPHGCDMAMFEPQLFLNTVQGKTLAFAGDSVGRNQMESLLCLLSQVSSVHQCLF
jgi:hypothetical protein